MLSWRVIFPRGDLNRLDIAEISDYELDDWCIASRKEFVGEVEAHEYMVLLAEKNSLKYPAKRGYNNFLD